MFLRALARELGKTGRECIACFPSEPTPEVQRFLDSEGVQTECEAALFEGPVLRRKRALTRLIRLHRPAVVHFHFMGLITGYPWAARLAGAEGIFLTDHKSLAEDEPERPWPRWKALAARAIQGPISSVVTVSEFQRAGHLKRGSLPAELMKTIYNGVDVARADACTGNGESFRRNHGIPSDRLLITQLSWLIAEKGVEDFLAAAGLLRERFPDLHFCIAGKGPAEQQFRELAGAGRLQSSVTFTGDLNDPFRSGVFEATDIFCQPSRWQEAFGWVITEAMAFRKPVVGTGVGGIPEVITDGVTGFVTAPRDPAAMAERIGQLICDAGLRRRMGENGRLAVEKKFSLDANIAQYLKIYGIAG